ncbi:hypothetical protein [Leptospira sp. 'Mane']|uniref:hypothetical protein n=1 Tax=Leptospira sp. 'Mane' TaxID=3387407 RepID=UPI00398B1923
MFKNIIFVFIILICFGLLAGSAFFINSRTIRLDPEEGIRIPDRSGENVLITKGDDFSTFVFSGFTNCPTICANSLPWLEKIASESPQNKVKVIFLDLGELGNSDSGKMVFPFPHIRRVSLDKRESRQILEKLKLNRSNTNHHSSRLLIHREFSDQIEWVDRVDSRFYANWAKPKSN